MTEIGAQATSGDPVGNLRPCRCPGGRLAAEGRAAGPRVGSGVSAGIDVLPEGLAAGRAPKMLDPLTTGRSIMNHGACHPGPVD